MCRSPLRHPAPSSSPMRPRRSRAAPSARSSPPARARSPHARSRTRSSSRRRSGTRASTASARRSALVKGAVAQDSPLGYSSAGTVLDTGGVAGLHVGERVACSGAGRANHAEVVSVPANLVVPVPEAVSAQGRVLRRDRRDRAPGRPARGAVARRARRRRRARPRRPDHRAGAARGRLPRRRHRAGRAAARARRRARRGAGARA